MTALAPNFLLFGTNHGTFFGTANSAISAGAKLTLPLNRSVGNLRQRFDRSNGIRQPQVGVDAHRQTNVRMPQKLLGEARWYAGLGKQRCEGMSQRMKVHRPPDFRIGTPDQ